MPPPAPQPDALLSWMEVLADPTRLRLLRLLERHELGVAELCDVLQLPQSAGGRHPKGLADQRRLRGRAHSTTNLYRMGLGELDPAARRLWTLTREQTDDWATVAQDQLRLTRRLAERQPSQGFFAGAAGRWDRLREELYGKTFTQEGFLGLLPAGWVGADLGCGTGQVTAALAPPVRGLLAIDQSAAMLRAARRRTSGLDNVELKQGSLESLPLDAGACDGALLLLAPTYVRAP